MKLFDSFDQTYMGIKLDSESQYDYLNRSARLKFAAARQLLEEWFAQYPQSAQGNLAKNFKTDTYGPHLGAFFELYCHALWRAHGYTVSVEQVVDTAKGNPIDLVVGPIQNPDCCVEATVVADAKLTISGRRQIDTLEDRLNRIPSNRQLMLEIVASSSKQLPLKDIVADVRQWLTSLDASSIPSPTPDDDYDKAASFTWRGHDWELRFEVVPGERVDDLVIWNMKSGWTGATKQRRSRLQLTLEEKADQHSGLQVPYIIAVDMLGEESIYRLPDSIADDLFGKEIVLVSPDTGDVVDVKRAPELPGRSDRENGLWLGRGHARNQHVSAVLLVNEVVPWSVMDQTPVLWHNPWALRPLPTTAWLGPQRVPDASAGTLELRAGKSIRSMFQGAQ